MWSIKWQKPKTGIQTYSRFDGTYKKYGKFSNFQIWWRQRHVQRIKFIVFALQFLFLPQKEKKKKEKMKNIRKIQRQIVWKPPYVVTSLCLHLINADTRYLDQLSLKSGLYGIQFINASKHIPKWDLHPFKVIGFFLHPLKTSENLEFSVVFWGIERGKMWK